MDEKFDSVFCRSGHGSGNTSSETPFTLEQNHGENDSEPVEKTTFERNIGVKGESTIPEKFPAIATFAPITFSKVTLPTTGTALGSYLSSG